MTEPPSPPSTSPSVPPTWPDPADPFSSGVPGDPHPAVRSAGLAVCVLAVVVAAAALVLASVASHAVLVVGTAALTVGPLLAVAIVSVCTAGLVHLLVRPAGPTHPAESAVLCGTALGLVLPLLLCIPLVGFFALGPVLATEELLRPVPVAVALGAVGTGTGLLAVTARGRPPAIVRWPRSGAVLVRAVGQTLGAVLVAGAVAALTTTTVSQAFLTLGRDVVVAREPGGCTAVVEHSRGMVAGDAVLLVAGPGSPVAHRHTTYHLPDPGPLSSAGLVLEARATRVTISIDDLVEEAVTCR